MILVSQRLKIEISMSDSFKIGILGSLLNYPGTNLESGTKNGGR
jgi:hypothetical protein